MEYDIKTDYEEGVLTDTISAEDGESIIDVRKLGTNFKWTNSTTGIKVTLLEILNSFGELDMLDVPVKQCASTHGEPEIIDGKIKMPYIEE